MHSDESLRGELLTEVEAVAPILTEYAAESEKLGRLNEPTVEALRKTRLLRFACPRDLGGDEADPFTVMEVLEAVTRNDGYACWKAACARRQAAHLALGDRASARRGNGRRPGGGRWFGSFWIRDRDERRVACIPMSRCEASC